MGGGWSQVDTFDPKPALAKYAGQPIDGKVQGDVIVRQGFPGPLMPSPFTFRPHGQSGVEDRGDLPAPEPPRRRDRVSALGVRAIERSRARHVRDADRADQSRISERRLVGDLRSGIGASSLPAYVVMTDARGGPLGGPNDWSARLHPGSVSGHAVSLERRSDRRPETAAGLTRAISGRGSTRSRS
jgi:hypothetical protein